MFTFDEVLTHNRDHFKAKVRNVKERFISSAVRRFMDEKPFRATVATVAQRHAAEELVAEEPNRWELNDGILSLVTDGL